MIAFHFGILILSTLATNLPSDTFPIVWLSTGFVVKNVPVGIFIQLYNILADTFDSFLASTMGCRIYLPM